VELDIGQSDIDNLELRIIPPVDIPGRVVFEDEEARRGPRPRSVSLEDSGNRTSKQFEEDSFQLKGVQPGIYRVSVGGPIYVRSMQYGEANIEGSQLDLRSGAAATLTLHVASAAGTITGTVRDDKGPVAGASVVVAQVTGEHSQYQVRTKPDGTYTIRQLPPGKYRVAAMDEADASLALPSSQEDFDDWGEAFELSDRESVTKDLKVRSMKY